MVIGHVGVLYLLSTNDKIISHLFRSVKPHYITTIIYPLIIAIIICCRLLYLQFVPLIRTKHVKDKYNGVLFLYMRFR